MLFDGWLTTSSYIQVWYPPGPCQPPHHRYTVGANTSGRLRLLTSLHLSQEIKETAPTAALDTPHDTVHVSVDQRTTWCLLASHGPPRPATAPPCFAEARGLVRCSLTFSDLTANDFSTASPELSPSFHLPFPGMDGGRGSEGEAQEVGVICESGKCCGPCMILNDNFTTYIVTSWPIPHCCSLIYCLRSSFALARPPPSNR